MQLGHVVCVSLFPGMWADLGRLQLAVEGAEIWRGGPRRGRPRRYGHRTSCRVQLVHDDFVFSLHPQWPLTKSTSTATSLAPSATHHHVEPHHLLLTRSVSFDHMCQHSPPYLFVWRREWEENVPCHHPNMRDHTPSEFQNLLRTSMHLNLVCSPIGHVIAQPERDRKHRWAQTPQ